MTREQVTQPWPDTDSAARAAHRAAREQDNVYNPQHYKQGKIECIEAIQSALTEEEFRGYCKGNAMKYIWRERHKGGKESIEKAAWYLDYMAQCV
jgi:hypothetical protein